MFYRIAHQTIMSGLVVRYKEVDAPGGLEISASRDGVQISGHSSTLTDITDILDLLVRCKLWVAIIKSGATSQEVNSTAIETEPKCVTETRKAHFAGDDEVLETRKCEKGNS